MFYQNKVVPAYPTANPFACYLPNIPLQHVHINGFIYPIFPPVERYTNNIIPMSEVQTKIIPKELHKIQDNNPKKIHTLKSKRLCLMNEEIRTKNTQLKKKDHNTGKVCWHFLRGFCKRGKCCGFRHSVPITTNKSRKKSRPEASSHITEDALIKELSDLSLNVSCKMKRREKSWPRKYRGLDPGMQALSEKELLVGDSRSVSPSRMISNFQCKRFSDVTKRSIFLGGLSKGVTCQMIRIALERHEARVVSIVPVKKGFCPKVTLATIYQASKLISTAEIEIDGSLVEVRPYRPRSSFDGFGKHV
jgi:hypothetical protein